jgi:hypothetical protein
MPVKLRQVDLSQSEERGTTRVHARVSQVQTSIVVADRKK